MAEGSTSNSVTGEDAERGFEMFEEEDEKEETMEMTGEGGRRRIFSKVYTSVLLLRSLIQLMFRSCDVCYTGTAMTSKWKLSQAWKYVWFQGIRTPRQ